MSLVAVAFLIHAASLAASPPASKADAGKKQAAAASIDAQRADLVSLADQVWAFAETALRETRSAALLAGHAEKRGFRVERGAAGMPTAFVASYGQGRPVVAVLGEYDALPGLSQKAVPERAVLREGAPGHGCGHNLFGAASLGAAIAVKELIAAGRLSGTVRYYGTPAEEAVGGKVYMIREGLFRDVDAVLAWHPDDRTQADTEGGQAIVDLMVEFQGRTSHAAFDPWNGRSALDAAELFTHGVNTLREHVKPTVRMHYVIPDGGDVPNVVPDHAKVWIWARDFERKGVQEVLERLRKVAEGAALMAGVTAKVTVQAGDYEMLVNEAGARLLDANLRWLGEVAYSPEEEAFARELQKAAGVEPVGMDTTIHPLEGQEKEGGSTDVGDVSWNVPTLHASVTTAPRGVPWHAWAVVAAGGMSIGHKGMIQAAKTLAATMVDLFDDPKALAAVRAEFETRTKGFVYQPFIPDGPPPVPKGE
ncbi:MAG TPA: amidohydrolase [Vicinamibacteria bacterium]|nr:amidohydrolase [Vicinamibacteria bacterium]